jgi:succinate-semialdehyde dehydrogenase/glutarate-semialdehyde dehydrogenase
MSATDTLERAAAAEPAGDYPKLELLIDGEFLGAEGRKTEDVFNPATGRVLGELPHATAKDLDRALAAAGRAFGPWRKTLPAERGRILRRAAELMRERVGQIAHAMTLEQGKPLAESKGEVLYSADVLDWYAEECRRAYGRIIPSKPGMRQLVTFEPVGVAVAFTPWNFPALTPARKIGGALAAGCPLILKAAEETPATAVALAHALVDAGLPSGVLNLVFGVPAEVSSRLIASEITRKVSFTGSVPVGKLLARQAVEGMKRLTLELGGHAPVVVFDDIDADATAKMLAAGKFRNAGQVCISPTRFYVQEKIFDRFADRFTEFTKTLNVGDGTKEGVTMGPLANPRRVEAMERFVEDARERGGDIRTGGKRRGNEAWFFEPTVVTGLPDDCKLMTEEPFGPIVPITPFKDFDEVMARANSLPFGLAAYAFTGDAKRATALGDGLKAGMVGVNTLSVSTPETPFGGVRDSGYGQEGGIEGLQAYLDLKLIAQA